MFPSTSSGNHASHRYEYHRIGESSQCWFIFVHFFILDMTHDDVILSKSLYSFSSIHIAGAFGVRHLQAFLVFLGLTLAYALRVNMSVAIVAMTDKHAANPDYEVSVLYTVYRLLIYLSYTIIYLIVSTE